MTRDNERVKRILRNADLKDRVEQVMGISETMTRRRDQREAREFEKREKVKRK